MFPHWASVPSAVPLQWVGLRPHRPERSFKKRAQDAEFGANNGLFFCHIDKIPVSKSAPKALILAPNRLRPGKEEAKQQEAQAQNVVRTSQWSVRQKKQASATLPRFSIFNGFSLLRRHRCASISHAGVCVGALSLLHLVQRGVKSLDLVSLVLQWLNQPINAS